MNEDIDIKDLDKARLLVAFVNNARIGGGYAVLNALDESGRPKLLTIDDAEKLLEESPPKHLSFDYVIGRKVKVDLTGDTLNPRKYDLLQSAPGVAAVIVEEVRRNPIPPSAKTIKNTSWLVEQAVLNPKDYMRAYAANEVVKAAGKDPWVAEAALNKAASLSGNNDGPTLPLFAAHASTSLGNRLKSLPQPAGRS